MSLYLVTFSNGRSATVERSLLEAKRQACIGFPGDLRPAYVPWSDGDLAVYSSRAKANADAEEGTGVDAIIRVIRDPRKFIRDEDQPQLWRTLVEGALR